MYRKETFQKTSINKASTAYEGETIETKVNRVLRNKEPIKDGAPIIFMERREGVLPAYNIRTDRFDEALKGTDTIAKARIAKRDGAPNIETKKPLEGEGETATG